MKKPFEGVVPNLERRYLATDSDWSREEIARYMTATPCGACRGFGLKPDWLLCEPLGNQGGLRTYVELASQP